MLIKPISAGNFKKIRHKAENWSPEYRAHLSSLINKLGPNRKVYVAVSGKKVIGFMIYSVSTRRDSTIINVDLTSVDPEHRNQGIATALKLHLAKRNKKATITAEVNPKNMPSVAVNMNLGASAVGHIMTMNPATMLEKAAEKQQRLAVPTGKKQFRALSNIQKEKNIKAHGCPPGKSKVRGYQRKDGIRVAAYCRKVR